MNKLFTGDNLYILHGLNSESVDLIYLDPPFNSKRKFDAPIGSKAAGASFEDMWNWSDVDSLYLEEIINNYPFLVQFIQTIGRINGDSMKSYITYMTQRIIEMKRILKNTGSFYLHCDSTASHYLKIVCDRIFKKNNFRNEIIWKRLNVSGKESQYKKKKYSSNTDIILFYTKSDDYFINPYRKLNEDEMKIKFPYGKFPNRYKLGTRLFRSTTAGPRPNLCYQWRGFKNRSEAGWALSKERLEEEYQKGNIVIKNEKSLERRSYEKDYKGEPISNIWDDLNEWTKNERTKFPTQKPLSLMKRILLTSSKENDVVLDPFCGCATTCIAAQQLNRKWIGIDISEASSKIMIDRLSDDSALFKDFINIKSPPKRSDIKEVPVSNILRQEIYTNQKGQCNACDLQTDLRHFELDHIIPRSKGGGDYFENYQLLCSSCNRIKGDRPMAYLLLKIQKINKLHKYELSFS
tara:strand:+ start:173 stop:1564 length:1392 start_codon:yes stop_codon:yes gene_type:complete